MSPELIHLTVDNIIPTLVLRYNEHLAKYTTHPTRLTISWTAWRLLGFVKELSSIHDCALLTYEGSTPYFNGCKMSIDCDILDDLLYFTEGKE